MTDIQERALSVIENGNSCIITAPTGSGKTEAALFPIIDMIRKMPKHESVDVIYITPLRALNRDLLSRLETVCGKYGITVSARHGDTSSYERSKQSRKPPNILITTPETLQSMFLTKLLYQGLKSVKYVIVDELHDLYYNKRGAQLSVALERLTEISGEFQRIGISATIGNIDEVAKFLCSRRKYELVRSDSLKTLNVSISMPSQPSKEYKELAKKFSIDKDAVARLERVVELSKAHQKSLIFTNTRQMAESLANKLLYLDDRKEIGGIGIHHGSLDKDERIEVEEKFKKGKIRSIVATSSLELGIDIGDVDFAVQYGSPKQVTRLVQRIGRSGHSAGSSSNGEVIVANNMEALESAAIVELAHSGSMEIRNSQQNPLDVLANQLCAISLEYGSVSRDKVASMLRRSYCFNSLSDELLDKVLTFCTELRLLTFEKNVIKKWIRTREYVINNISVIPDSVKIVVKNVSTNKIVGSLDEEFLYNNVEEGATFIAKGLAWKVLSIEDNTVYVEPSSDVDAIVPEWDGEDIPVSRDVATLSFSMLSNEKEIEKCNAMSKHTLSAVHDFLEKQKASFIPKKRDLIIEEYDQRIIIYTALGKLANSLLSKLIAGIFAMLNGTRVAVKATAYAVVVDGISSSHSEIEKAISIFKNFNIENAFAENGIITNSDTFRYRFVQAAKMFGIIDKKAAITRNVATRLMHFYKDSPIPIEAMRDVMQNSFDIEAVSSLQSELKNDSRFITFISGSDSPLSMEILRAAYSYKEFLSVPSLGSEVVKEFVTGVLNKNAELICTFCGLRFTKKIDEIEAKIACIRCKSPMVAIYAEGDDKVLQKVHSNKRLTKSEMANYDRLLACASLIDAYGKRAVIALATYGVGIKTAGRVLAMLRSNTDLFVIDLINAQRQFIKNRKYWAV